MDQKELDKIYYELEEVSAILWMFSNISENIETKNNIAITASHYHEYMKDILKRIEKIIEK